MSDIVETLRHIRSPFASLAAAEITRLRAERDAAQEREREALTMADDAEMVERVANDEAFLQAIVEHASAVLHGRYFDAGEYRRAIARAALSAMRGKP